MWVKMWALGIRTQSCTAKTTNWITIRQNLQYSATSKHKMCQQHWQNWNILYHNLVNETGSLVLNVLTYTVKIHNTFLDFRPGDLDLSSFDLDFDRRSSSCVLLDFLSSLRDCLSASPLSFSDRSRNLWRHVTSSYCKYYVNNHVF